MALLVAIWLAFTFPAFAGKARFPVDFAGPAPGQVARPLANPELGDAFYAFYPWHSYLGERLRSGHLPLWDPYRFGGTAFTADIATGVFYPPNWLYATGHILLTFTLIAVASLLASLLMAFWFLRLVRLHPYAAAVGAVVWTFSAFLTKYSMNEAVFASVMWLPLALGGLEVARRGRTRRGLVLATAGLALSVLGGHAQMALIVWTATGLWAVIGMAFTLAGKDPTEHAGLRRQATTAAAAFGLALGVAAIQLLPTAQFAGLILRQHTTYELARRTSLPTEQAPTLVMPDYRGSPLDGNFAGPGVNYTETAIYAGVLTLPLAALGLLHRPGRVAVFFGVITVIGLLATFGTPFYRLILLLPGFSRTLFVTRFIFLVDVGLAGLATVGVHSLVSDPTRRSVSLLLTFLAIVLAVLAVLTIDRNGTPLPASYIVPRGVWAMALVLAGGIAVGWLMVRPSNVAWVALVLLAIFTADLWHFAFPLSVYQSPRQIYAETPAVEYLASSTQPRPRYANMTSYSIGPNGGLQYHLYGLEGYDPFVPKRIVELVALADDQIEKASFNFFGPFDAAAFRSPVMDLLGVGTAVAAAGPSASTTGIAAGNAVLIDRPTAFPPVFLTSCSERMSDGPDLDRLRSMSASDLRGTAVIAGAGAATTTPGPGGCGSAGEATLERYDPERVVTQTSAGAASVLVLSDAWFPGWSVTVDGKDAPVLRVDHALRGVALPPGQHRVEFRFRPPLIEVGAVISALSLLFLGVLAVASVRERDAGRPLEDQRR